MEIVGTAAHEVLGVETFDFLGLDDEDVFAGLETAGDLEERFLGDNEAEFFEKFGADDGVTDAGFVLEADEDNAFGGAGALAANDVSGNTDDLALAPARK